MPTIKNKTRVEQSYEGNVMEMLDVAAETASEPDLTALPPSEEDIAAVLQVLTSMESYCRDMADKCTATIEAVKTGQENIVNGSLPKSFSDFMTRTLLSVEGFLYRYADISQFDFNAIRKYNSRKRTGDCSNVSIQYYENKVVIRIPFLPKRNYGNKSVVNQMLAAKLFEETSFPKWERWSAVFYHVYPTKTTKIPRDVDNYDYKKTIDLIAFALGTNDNACNYDMKMTTVFTDKLDSGVYIEVTPKSLEFEALPQWVKNKNERVPR